MTYRRFFTVFTALLMIVRTNSTAIPNNDSLNVTSSTSAPNHHSLDTTSTTETSINTEAKISNEIFNNSSQTPPFTSTLTTIATSTLPTPKIKSIPYPFVVSIQIYERGVYKHICGGAILDKEFVLTAAHCTLKPRQLYARDLIVAAGSNVLLDKKAKRVRVRNMVKHPNFKPLYGNDVLLLHLANPLPIDNIRYATINFRKEIRKGGSLNSVLLGWGRTQPNRPKNIEAVHFQTIADDKCLHKHGFRYLTHSEICAVNTKGPRGACDGDSGGPLVDLNQKSLYGLLSYGRTPCVKGKPFAFTRISVYVKWIEEQMRNMQRLKKRAGR